MKLSIDISNKRIKLIFRELIFYVEEKIVNFSNENPNYSNKTVLMAWNHDLTWELIEWFGLKSH